MKPDPHEPLSKWLEPAIDEPRIARAWQRIRSAQASPEAHRRRGRGWSWAWRWLAPPAGLFAAAAALWLLWLRPPPPDALRAVDAAVSLAAGAEVHEVPGGIALRDGSQLGLSQGAQLQVLENDGQRFVASLRRGDARFAVQPGPRRWTIETELASIEVIGAVVIVAHDEHLVRVAVHRGVVVVRGERVPGRVARLVEGQELVLSWGPAGSELAAAPPMPPIAPPTTGTPTTGMTPTTGTTAPLAPTAPAPPVPSLTAPAVPSLTAPTIPSVLGGPRRAGKAAPAAPPAPRAAPPAPRSLDSAAPAPVAVSDVLTISSTAQALRDADRLRRLGDARAAAALLEEALRQRPADPGAGVVEHTLGRLYLDHLDQPARAAAAFAAVIARGSPQPLIEGALARRCEALWRAGEAAAARAAVDEYRQRYPQGSWLAALSAMVSGP